MSELNKSRDSSQNLATGYSEGGQKKKQSNRIKSATAKPETKRKEQTEEIDQSLVGKSYFRCHFKACNHDKQESRPSSAIQKDKKQSEKGCPVCKSQIKDAERYIIKVEKKLHYYKQRDDESVFMFRDLIFLMISDQASAKERMIKGCQIFLPETVFFKEGKVEFITTMDKDCCLSFDLKIMKLTKNLTEVRTKLQDIVQERMNKECEMFGRQLAAQGRQKNQVEQSMKQRGKFEEKTKLDNKLLKQETVQQQQTPVLTAQASKKKDEKKNQATIIVKYRGANDPEIANLDIPYDVNTALYEILNDKEFSNMFEQKPKSQYWRTIEYVQTCVKDPIGIGKQILLNFYAPLNETNDFTAAQEINFDYKQMPDELYLLQTEQYREYCIKQCYKMCYYLQKVRGIEVLHMQIEFLRDEFNNIWLSYAKDIQIRRMNARGVNLNNYNPKSNVTQEVMDMYQNTQQQVLANELLEFESSLKTNEGPRKDGNLLKQKIIRQMDDHYNQMKQHIGIDPNYTAQEDDPDLDRVLKKLRPNSTASNFKDFLIRSQNFNKNTTWKQISRQVYETDQKRRIMSAANRAGNQINNVAKSMQFTKGEAMGKTNQIKSFDEIALDIGSEQAERKSTVFSSRSGVLDKLSGNLNLLNAYQTRPVVSGLKQISNLKGDLIRKNLVNRVDLMKLYQPPIKDSQLIENNPFFNSKLIQKEIVQQQDASYRKLLGQQDALNYLAAMGKTGLFRQSTNVASSSSFHNLKRSESGVSAIKPSRSQFNMSSGTELPVPHK